jgi:hypothetical protein
MRDKLATGFGRRSLKAVGAAVVLVVVAVAIMALSSRDASPVQADPHPGQSVNVVIIGGSTLDLSDPCAGMSPTDANVMFWTGGGCLPVTGPAGELGDFIFTPMDQAAVSAASLAPFDTAVLNMATSAMACNSATLSPAQQADLVAFVGGGKKLIIFDSECSPGLDYSWLPYPFTTNNPGAMGAPGTLTIVEENTLSSNNPADPHFIDAVDLSVNTDAVGDMNVMTTLDPNWCLDMSGTNYNNVTGPVHTYAKFPLLTDAGLIIYNGLDQDYQWAGNPNLRKIWVQELQQPFNPSMLPCGYSPLGIRLEPETASNAIGTEHTVTATLADLLGQPVEGIDVTFEVLSGPNAGETGMDTSDINGEATFTYAGDGGLGVDTIEACFTDQAGQEICSNIVEKEWIRPPNQPPVCSAAAPSVAEIWPPNHKMVRVNVLAVTDLDGDPISIVITGITQDEPVNGLGDGDTSPDGAGVGTNAAQVRAERAGTPKVPGNGRVYHIHFQASDGKGGACSGVVKVGVPHDQRRGHVIVDGGELFNSTLP